MAEVLPKVLVCAVLLLAGCAQGPRISDVTQARTLSDEGLARFNAGDYQGAVKALDSVIEAFGCTLVKILRKLPSLRKG